VKLLRGAVKRAAAMGSPIVRTLARFLALAKSGRPYEREMVIEDVTGRSAIEPYAAALQYQQKGHTERSVEYGKKVLDLGVKGRG
jgi:hypothetical protein